MSETETPLAKLAKAKKWTAKDVSRALRERHAGNAWAYLVEVRNEIGFANRVRSADAMAMSLWPSRGLELHGFEIKVSRTDWQKELSQPEKAEEIARYCDRWWLVVGDAAIVREGELPPTWGLLAPKGDKLVVVRQAPPLTPQPWPRGFIASLLRAATEQLAPEAELKRVRAEGYGEGAKHERENARQNATELERTVAEFEKASGVALVDVDRWQSGNIGEAVREVLAGRHLTLAREIEEFEKAAGLKLAETHWSEPTAREVGEAVRLVLADEGNGRGADALRRRLENTKRELEQSVEAIARILDGPKAPEATP